MSVYEFGVFGSVSLAEREILARTIESMVGDFGLVLGAEVAIHDAASVAGRDKHAAFTAVYFGSPDQAEADVVQDIVRENAPIIPTVGTTGNFATHIPDFLQAWIHIVSATNHPTELHKEVEASWDALDLPSRRKGGSS